ncbi:MAG: sugar phosphate isomerase/epimerase family protein [Opitutaceae bacterium]
MRPVLALSTCWCSHRHSDGYAMLGEMADLGFEYAELSHGVRISLVPGILRAVEEGVIKVGSAHNFCPLPAGVTQAAPNLFEPSATDARGRSQWLRHTRRSLDFAARVKARVLVCHLGSVGFFWFNPGAKLRRYVEARENFSAAADTKYGSLLARAIARLRGRMGPYWAQTRASVKSVLDYAAERGVRLGLENREKFEELPIDADFPELLAGLPAEAPAGYWHDTGHAHLKEEEGLLNHREQLERNAAHLLGFHLHDVNARRQDHQAVGSGRIDFEMVSGFWRPHHLLVLELSPRMRREEVIASRERLEALRARRESP